MPDVTDSILMNRSWDLSRFDTGELYRLDPTSDPRWERLLENCPDATIFHTPGWLKALRQTYGYEPVVFTTAWPGQELRNGIAFCRVSSWLTGECLVSVPFADHCEPLALHAVDRSALFCQFRAKLSDLSCSVELRPLALERLRCDLQAHFVPSTTFCHHVLSLEPDLDTLFRSFHKDCLQRRIRRAEQHRLIFQEGVSEDLLNQFYKLFVMTRRRHGVPPPPFKWFRNLRDCLDTQMTVGLISHGDRAIAAVITLRFKDKVIYKYGGSEAQYHSTGAVPLLFWRTIQRAKATGARQFDLGRTDHTDRGLIRFKDHFGARLSTISYFRYPAGKRNVGAISTIPSARKLVTLLPESTFRAIGALLYRHMG